MTENPQTESVRLNKFIAQRLALGRRQVDTLIEQGKVTINGLRPILGARVNPDKDTVSVDGSIVGRANEAYTYILLNKPVGYVCSRRQQGDAKTIYSILPKSLQHLKSVGRLDKDSSGLLLLTNDGDFAHKLTHPGFQKEKQYEVLIDRSLKQQDQAQISEKGVELTDGTSKLHLERLNNSKSWLVTMHEGRNRQIRRTFGALGYTVMQLHRTKFGSFELGDLAPRRFKELNPTKLKM